jgi:hypothetical protein
MLLGFGFPLIFVPIFTASYDGIPPSKTDQAFGPSRAVELRKMLRAVVASEFGRAADGKTMILAAIHEKRALVFGALDGKKQEAVPLSFGTYSIEVESKGERFVIFNHTLRTIRRPTPQG